MRPTILLGMVWTCGALAARPDVRPPPDRVALEEAREAARGDIDYASSASYAHFLRAQLARAVGDERKVIDELRLALATDDGNAHLLRELAEAHARLGELPRARRELERLIQRHPRDARAHLLLGRILQESGQTRRARQHLQRSIALAPTAPEGYLALIQTHLEAGALDTAERVADALAAAVPGETTGWRRLGLALAERGQHERAERLLRRALQQDPADVPAWMAIAKGAEAGGRLEVARDALAQAVSQAPDDLDVLLASGWVTLALGQETEARTVFARLLREHDEPGTIVRVALGWLERGAVEEAAGILEQGRARHPDEPRLAFYAGMLLERLQRFPEAAAAYAAVGPHPGLGQEAFFHRADCLSRAGRHVDALRLLRARVAAHPAERQGILGLSRALERAGKVREAEGLLTGALAEEPAAALIEAHASLLQRQARAAEAVALLERWTSELPSEPVLRFSLALAYERAGRRGEGLAVMRSLQREQPDNPPVLNFVGYTLAEEGQSLDEAERLVRRALELRPDTGAYLDSLGWVLLRKGDTGAALGVLERAAALEPGEPVILDHLGEALRRVGRGDEAQRRWRQALELLGDPDVDVPPGFRESVQGKLEALSESRTDR